MKSNERVSARTVLVYQFVFLFFPFHFGGAKCFGLHRGHEEVSVGVIDR